MTRCHQSQKQGKQKQQQKSFAGDGCPHSDNHRFYMDGANKKKKKHKKSK